MESRIAIIGIIVEDIDASSKVNDILHDYGMYILGRMGIVYILILDGIIWDNVIYIIYGVGIII